jgi:hypothetical protein
MSKRLVDEYIGSIEYDDDDYTPESMAWKLLIAEDTVNNGIMQFYNNGNDIDDRKSFIFEILITMYFEMLFNWHKLLFYMNLEDTVNSNNNINVNTTYEQNFNVDNLTIDDLTEPFKTKFHKINILLNVSIISDNYYTYLNEYKYCSVMLRFIESNKQYFEINKNNIDEDKQYHFILNSKYKHKTDIRDIFCLVNLGNKKLKINFNNIQ